MAESDYGFVTWRGEEMLRFEHSGVLQRDAMSHALKSIILKEGKEIL
jgi:hypothetical protein